jgi:hypothetical protein
MVSGTFGSDGTQLRLLRRVVLATDFSSRASLAVRRVVVGSHTETSMVRHRLGSVATHVVRHASCDVLVARRPSPVAVDAG